MEPLLRIQPPSLGGIAGHTPRAIALPTAGIRCGAISSAAAVPFECEALRRYALGVARSYAERSPAALLQPPSLCGHTPHAIALPAAGIGCGTSSSAVADPFGCEILRAYALGPRDCDQAPKPKPLTMDIAVCYLPDHDEDAHLMDVRAGVLGVADGVGGCRADGVDAATFARALCANAKAELDIATPGTPVCPRTLLERAYQQAVAAKTPGASTAVFLSLDGELLRWAYVGDSGFMLLRDGKVLHRSVPQQHYFNCPFQLTAAAAGGSRISDRISDAAVGETQVKKGDILVVGTDGLFDNVFEAYLEELVRIGTARMHPPKGMADLIACSACGISRSDEETPFNLGSRKEK